MQRACLPPLLSASSPAFAALPVVRDAHLILRDYHLCRSPLTSQAISLVPLNRGEATIIVPLTKFDTLVLDHAVLFESVQEQGWSTKEEYCAHREWRCAQEAPMVGRLGAHKGRPR